MTGLNSNELINIKNQNLEVFNSVLSVESPSNPLLVPRHQKQAARSIYKGLSTTQNRKFGSVENKHPLIPSDL